MSGISNSTALAADNLFGRNGVETCASEASPKVLLSRTTPNQNTRNALRSLVEHEMLAEYWTTFAWDSHSRWNRLLPGRWQAELGRRSISEAPASQVKCAPFREVVRLGLRSTPFERLLCSGERPFSVVKMGIDLDRHVSRRVSVLRPDLIYANDGAALETFREARRLGMVTVQEQSISYWRPIHELFLREKEISPEYANLLPALEDPQMHLERMDEELQLADYVFVPSDHVVSTLEGVVPKERIRMIPYGAPPVKPRAHVNADSRVPLKVLFAGSLTQRKGIGYLLKAMEMLGSRAELTVIGSRLRANARVDEACNRWKWHGSLPHSRVLEIMQQSDVLVLPSLSEGCALVVLEALACGLPVIVTPNTGSTAFVRDGQEGFVVPIRSAEAIAERLEFLCRDREKLAEMSCRAQAAAAQNSWEHYRAKWARALRSLACN